MLIDNCVIIRELHRVGVIIDSPNLAFGMIRLGKPDLPTQDRRRNRMVLFVEKGSHIVFRGKAVIGGGSKVLLRGLSELVLGEDFYVSLNSSFYCYKRIEFGNSCTIGWNVLVMDTDWHRTMNRDSGEYYPSEQQVRIGNHCWLCNDVQIQKGTLIPDNVIVAAKSLCNKEYVVPEYSLIAGIPAILKKENIDYVR